MAIKAKFKHRVIGLTAALACLAPAMAPISANAQTTQGIAAIVNDDIITSYDLRQRVLFLLATTGAKHDKASLLRLQQTALRNLIDERLQLQEMKKFDQSVADEEVDQSVASVIGRNGLSPEEVAETLAKLGAGLDTLRSQVRAEIAWQRIVSGLYGSRVRISDAQIDETYTRLSASASKPSYRVGEIYIEATPDIGGFEGAMTGAKAMVAQANKGAPFDLLAKQFSSAPSSAKGGDIGWVNEGELREEIDTVIRTMDAGSISDPIQVPGGVYVVAVIDKRISEVDTLFKLKQIRAATKDSDEDTATANLELALQSAKSCSTLKDDLEGFEGIEVLSMGEVKASAMNDTIKSTLEGVEEGQTSAIFPLRKNLASVMVCEKSVTGANVPTRDQIEDRLIDQQIAQASKRHLRNLRRDASIVIR